MRKPTIWVPTRSDTNRHVHSQKIVRNLKIWILEEEGLYYICLAKTKAPLVSHNADCWFSDSAARLVFSAWKITQSLKDFLLDTFALSLENMPNLYLIRDKSGYCF